MAVKPEMCQVHILFPSSQGPEHHQPHGIKGSANTGVWQLAPHCPQHCCVPEGATEPPNSPAGVKLCPGAEAAVTVLPSSLPRRAGDPLGALEIPWKAESQQGQSDTLDGGWCPLHTFLGAGTPTTSLT